MRLAIRLLALASAASLAAVLAACGTYPYGPHHYPVSQPAPAVYPHGTYPSQAGTYAEYGRITLNSAVTRPPEARAAG
jgi:hypothetical protein